MRSLALLLGVLVSASYAQAAPASATDPRGDVQVAGPNFLALSHPGSDLVAGSATGGDGVYRVSLWFADLKPIDASAPGASNLRFRAEAFFSPPEGLILVGVSVQADGSLFVSAYDKAAGFEPLAASVVYDAAKDVVSFEIAAPRHAGAPSDLGARAWHWICGPFGCERAVFGGYGGDGLFTTLDEMGVAVRRSGLMAALPF